MKRAPFIVATIALFLPALHIAGQEGEKAPATVILTGKCTSYSAFSFRQVKIRLGDNIQKKLAEALNQAAVVLSFDLDEQTHLFVISTPRATPGPSDAIFVFGKKYSGVTGRLIRSDDPDLIKALDAKKPRHVWLLVSDNITLVDDKNKARFPAPAMAQIEGELVSGDFSAGKQKSRLGIKNGAAGPIMLVGPAVQTASEIRGKVRAAGKLEMIDGGLILTAKKIEVAKASKGKEPANSKLWREFDPKSPLAACQDHFDKIDENGARAGLSFNESPNTYKLFNAAGKISADKLDQLLATLKKDLHKMAKRSGMEMVGEPSDKVEDRPISVVRAMYAHRLIMPGSVRGFYVTYRDGKVVGAIDVIAVLNSSSAIDRWEICCAVHEVVAE
jgi:hypothetical protein